MSDKPKLHTLSTEHFESEFARDEPYSIEKMRQQLYALESELSVTPTFRSRLDWQPNIDYLGNLDNLTGNNTLIVGQGVFDKLLGMGATDLGAVNIMYGTTIKLISGITIRLDKNIDRGAVMTSDTRLIKLLKESKNGKSSNEQ